MFNVKIIKDSIAPCGKRLITLTATYPRFVHSELLTHRALARNSASSRAIPWKKLRKQRSNESEEQYKRVLSDEFELDRYVDNCMFKMIATTPVVPIKWGAEQPKMQMGDALGEADSAEATRIWMKARMDALQHAEKLAELGVHKALCNRLTEPFMWITVLITATEWNNFFRLRCHTAAEIHLQHIAYMMKDAIKASQPLAIAEGAWHLPFIDANDCYSTPELLKISTGRCARVSFLTHEGKRDPSEDIKLHDRLLKPPGEADEDIMHASPFEHVAQATTDSSFRSGPFFGWKQYRKFFVNENVEG